MSLIRLYMGTVTAGEVDGTPVSIGTGLSPIESGLLNGTMNEETEPFKIAIRCEAGYQTVGDVVISPTSDTSNKWRFAKDNAGSIGSLMPYGSPLTLDEVIDDTNTIIWCQVRATDDELAQIDDSVKINITTSIIVQEEVV